jgi:uncharacterized protein YcbK (DUF882 family)
MSKGSYPYMASSLFSRRSFLKFSTFAAVTGPQLLRAATPERSLSLYNLHTTENLKVVYWADGGYVPQSLAAIDRVLRDHRTGTIHTIDRRLLDLLWQIRTQLNTIEPFQIISGYRSPQTNAMLRANSKGVATHSLHMDGMAADISVPGRTLESIRKVAMTIKGGGVGYYPAQFVHVDVGRVRAW